MIASDSLRYRPERPPLKATAGEFMAFVGRKRCAAMPPPAGGSSTRGVVLVIPCLLHGDRHTDSLRDASSRHGYAAQGWGLGVNVGPTRRLLDGADAVLTQLADKHGPVSLVGLSMGGLFCRWLAFHHPTLVRQVITVCSPFRAAPDSCFLPLQPLLRVWPGVDLARLAAEIERPLSVPVTSVYSSNDGIVAPESCFDPVHPADCFAIDGPHVTIATDPAVKAIVLNRLLKH